VSAPRSLLATALTIISCAALTAAPAVASQTAPAPPLATAAARGHAGCARKSSAHATRRAGANACRASTRKPRVQRPAKSRPVKPRTVHVRRERSHPKTTSTPAETSEPGGAPAQETLAERNAATIAAVLATPCPNTELTPEPANIALVRAAVLCLINRKRAENGDSPLKLNAQLEQAAEGHCTELIAEDYFAHVSPSGETPVDRIRDTGYIPSPSVGYVIGENLAWGTYQLSTPQSIVSAWIASPGHLANILEAQYTETGIGVTPAVPSSLAAGAPGATYAQEFGVIIP
jgi:uncharacterized protein YkwD